jgi:hypothetical protein
VSLPLPTTATALPPGGVRGLLRAVVAADEFGNPPQDALTGRLVFTSPERNRHASIYLRAGRVYATALDGYVPPVADRLLTAGLINRQCREHLRTVAADKVSARAVELGYCTDEDVEDIHRQVVLATVTNLYSWSTATWHWDGSAVTEAYTISGLEPHLLVISADERIGQWGALERNFPAATKGDSVPLPGPDWTEVVPEMLGHEIAAIVQQVDGTRSVSDIAAACGFTRFEIAARLAKAIADGILIVTDPSQGDAVIGDGWDTPAAAEHRQYELEYALAMVEQARTVLAEAEARLQRAKKAAGV